MTLEVKASDPDSADDLTYTYSPSAGAIVGNGATVEWDLTRVRLGFQTVKVQVTDQLGARTTSMAQG